MYRRLVVSQTIFMGTGVTLALTALFTPSEWFADAVDHETAMRVGMGMLLTAFAYYCAQVVHELGELNDQLAGRSAEFRDLLNDLGDRNGG